MSAEVLRRAADLMRERAGRSIPSPWHVDRREDGRAWLCDRRERTISMHGYPSTAEHIASWHPAVALAVADWLDGVALHLEARADEQWIDLDGDLIAPEDTHAIGSALAVARAYLGESA